MDDPKSECHNETACRKRDSPVKDPGRCPVAEFIGMAFLPATAVGSDITAEKLSPDNVATATGQPRLLKRFAAPGSDAGDEADGSARAPAHWAWKAGRAVTFWNQAWVAGQDVAISISRA